MTNSKNESTHVPVSLAIFPTLLILFLSSVFLGPITDLDPGITYAGIDGFLSVLGQLNTVNTEPTLAFIGIAIVSFVAFYTLIRWRNNRVVSR